MPPLDYTTDALIEAARADAELPEWEDDEAPARFLAMMNRLQRLQLAALLQKAKEQYRYATLDIPLEDGELRYDLPRRAVAAGIVQAHFIDDSGNLLETVTVFPVGRRGERGWAGAPGKAYLEGNQLVLYSAPSGSGTLQIVYNRRLSELVLAPTADASFGATQIEEVLSATQFTIDTDVDVPGDPPWDLVRATPHFDILAMDVDGSEVGGTVTIPAGLPDGLVEGDYLCVAGVTPVCQAPLELHPVLSLMTAYRWTKANGDPLASSLKTDVDEAVRQALDLLTPRIEAQPAVIINTNGPGFRRWGRGFRR